MTASTSLGTAATAPARTPGWRLALALLAVVCLYLAVAWAVGGGDTLAAAGRIGWRWMAFGLLLTTLNYALRALRWHLVLRAAGASVPPLAGSAIYLAGTGLSLTPGKLGETVRSAFLVRHGVAVATSLAAFVVDRLSDLHAMLLIATVSLALAGGWGDPAVAHWAWLLAAVALSPLLLRLFLQNTAGPRRRAGRLRIARLVDPLLGAGTEFLLLWRPGLAAASIALSLVAYALQAGTFAGMVAQVAPAVSPWAAAAVFAAGTLAGAVSFVPGGIGAMELALVLLLGAQGVPTVAALAAALCLRAVTFWWGLVLGAAGLAVAGRLAPSSSA